MNPLINQIDDQFLKQVYYAVLGRKDDIKIVRYYANYIIQHVDIRRMNEIIGDIPLIQIENDLTVSFDSNFLNPSEQTTVIDFLKGCGLPVK